MLAKSGFCVGQMGVLWVLVKEGVLSKGSDWVLLNSSKLYEATKETIERETKLALGFSCGVENECDIIAIENGHQWIE